MARCLVISDFNTQNFCAYLENDEELPPLESLAAPFAMVEPVLADGSHLLWQGQPEYALVWTQPAKAVPSFQSVLHGDPVAPEIVISEVDAYCSLLLSAAARVKALFVPAWVHDSADRGLGMLDWKSGVSQALARMNLRLTERLSTAANIFVLDAPRWIATAGPEAFNPKLWYQGKIPFGNPVFQAAVADVKAAIRGLQGQARKLIVVDLDDTLWGGVVGDVGWQNLRLGGHDGIGEAYADFQRALKALTRRGILLGIVSKNQEHLALEAIRNHPEMQLREGDFAGWSINWNDKAANLAELVGRLNLGLQSVVFIDDHPVERARVREAFPEVLVPDWPESPMLFRAALQSLTCFDSPAVSAEDRERARSYSTDRQRTELKSQAGSIEDWLKSLSMEVVVEPLNAANLSRASQLLNKTNQMNLATRRMTEGEFKAWSEGPQNRVWTFRVTDKFGDSGLTGLASLRTENGTAQIVDFVLSCRVMGRKVEETMLYWLVEMARASGAISIRAEYLPSAKNQPCLEFLQRSGLSCESANVFTLSPPAPFPLPSSILLKQP